MHLVYAPVIKPFIQIFHLILKARILVDTYLCVSICPCKLSVFALLICSMYSMEIRNLYFEFKVGISVQEYVHLQSKVSKTRRHSEI